MSSVKDCGTEMNILQPLNPKKLSTLEEVLETFACDPPKDGGKVIEEKSDEKKHGNMAYGSGAYTLMPRENTYALGVWALKDSFTSPNIPDVHTYIKDNGNKIIRPLTFRENLIARLEDYFTEKDSDGNERTEKDRRRFFEWWLDSCTGIAYKAGTTKFKIIPQCRELITISPDFNRPYLGVPYDALSGFELDSGMGKYNASLTKEEVQEHPGWLAALEDDKVLLKDYTELIFAFLKEKNKRDSGMRFVVAPNQDQDKLRALFVNNLNDGSVAYGNFNLYNVGSFLRVTPVIEKKSQI